jgi:hypothetical protein
MVLVARVDPALRLARLRAAAELVEVRGDELAFTAAEAGELLVVLGRLALGADDIDMLVERTEGWPAALVLAWLWLWTVEDPARAVRAFGGDNRFVAGYPSGEVLAALDEDGRAFLYGVAVLGEFTAELCDAVLDRSDSAAHLVELERSNLFVSRLERGGWFRIHSLFAEYATTQLRSLEPGAPAVIHRRAAAWLRSRGLAVEAVDHAAAAGDLELVAELMVEHHLALIRDGAGRTVLRWARALPEDRNVQHPELAAAGAAAAILVGGRRLEQRRLLALGDVARAGQPEQADATSRRRQRWSARSRSTGEWGRRCSTVDVRSSWRRLTRMSSSPELWSPTPAPCSSPASSTRLRRWRCGRSSTRRSNGSSRAWWSPTRRSHLWPSSADGSTPHEATPRRRRRPSAGSARAAPGLEPTRLPPWVLYWRPRGPWSMPSTSSPRRSASSPTRWRPCTTPGCSSCWPASGRDAGVSPKPRRRCVLRGRRSASSATADPRRQRTRSRACRRGGTGARRGERPRVRQRRAARAAERCRAPRAAATGHRPVRPRDQQAPVPLPEHDPVAHARALPQARGPLPVGRGRPRHRGGTAGANAITHVKDPRVGQTRGEPWDPRRHG